MQATLSYPSQLAQPEEHSHIEQFNLSDQWIQAVGSQAGLTPSQMLQLYAIFRICKRQWGTCWCAINSSFFLFTGP